MLDEGDMGAALCSVGWCGRAGGRSVGKQGTLLIQFKYVVSCGGGILSMR